MLVLLTPVHVGGLIDACGRPFVLRREDVSQFITENLLTIVSRKGYGDLGASEVVNVTPSAGPRGTPPHVGALPAPCTPLHTAISMPVHVSARLLKRAADAFMWQGCALVTHP